MIEKRVVAARRRVRRILRLGALASLSACGTATERPDLLLISIDTLRPDRLACYGGSPDVGSAICALAAQGTRFAWAFATAPSTAPSIASLLTSRQPREHGVTPIATSVLAAEIPTLADQLHDAGYATGAFVANPVLRGKRGFARGFDVYDERMLREEPHRPGLFEREAAELSDAALAWLRVAKRPRFAWIHYQDPHGPYEPPDARPVADPPGAPRLPVLPDHSGWKGIPAYQVLPGATTLPAYRERYDAEIRWLDGHLGRLVAELDAGGSRPTVVITADHGEAFGEDDFYFAHGHSVGLDQIRVPMIYRPTQPMPATVVAEPVSTLDVAPTLLAAAGLAPRLRSSRILPSGPGTPRDGKRTLFAEHPLRIAVVAGDAFYSRDREPLSAPVTDPVSGGFWPPLAPRTAHLAVDGSATAGATTDASASELESLAAAFLSLGSAAVSASAPLDPKTREALRALGYLE